jgi:hypothetical protein
MRITTFRNGKEPLFLNFGFEGSQAVPARPSDRGTFERT